MHDGFLQNKPYGENLLVVAYNEKKRNISYSLFLNLMLVLRYFQWEAGILSLPAVK